MPAGAIQPQGLPYLSHAPTDGRVIPILPFLGANGVWHIYLKRPDGLLQVIPANPVAGQFLAAPSHAAPTDMNMPLADMIIQRFSFADVMAVLNEIHHDVVNSLASIHRYFVLLAYANTVPTLHPHALVSTELEFAFANYRAFYDLLTKLFIRLYARFTIRDEKGRQLSRANIPDSFNRLLQKTDDELTHKFHLAAPVVAFLRNAQGVFVRMCKIRDNIVHHGHSPDLVFHLPDGFALSLRMDAMRDLRTMKIWPEALLKPNELASVLALLVFLADDMLHAMTGLAAALEESLTQLPTAIATGHKVYLRDQLLVHANHLSEYRKKHWFDSSIVLAQCQHEWESAAARTTDTVRVNA